MGTRARLWGATGPKKALFAASAKTLGDLGTGIPQELSHSPAVCGEARRHCGGAGPTVVPQAAMWADEIIVDPPPLDLALQALSGLRRGPGAARSGGHTLPHGQIEAFHKGGLQPPTPTQGAQGHLESVPRTTTHLVPDAHEAAALIALVQLAVEQPGIDLPATASSRSDPGPEVRGERIEVEAQSIGGDHRRASPCWPLGSSEPIPTRSM